MRSTSYGIRLKAVKIFLSTNLVTPVLQAFLQLLKRSLNIKALLKKIQPAERLNCCSFSHEIDRLLLVPSNTIVFSRGKQHTFKLVPSEPLLQSKFWLLTKACHEKHFEDLSPSHRHRTWLDLTLKIRSMTSKYELVLESLTFETVYDNLIWSSKKAPPPKNCI